MKNRRISSPLRYAIGVADEVDQPPRAGVAENPPWVPDVLVDDRDAGVVSGQQRPGTGEHDGIGVDVDDAGAGLDHPGHFVRAALAGQAGAEVNELPDALLRREARRLGEALPVGPGHERARLAASAVTRPRRG